MLFRYGRNFKSNQRVKSKPHRSASLWLRKRGNNEWWLISGDDRIMQGSNSNGTRGIDWKFQSRLSVSEHRWYFRSASYAVLRGCLVFNGVAQSPRFALLGRAAMLGLFFINETISITRKSFIGWLLIRCAIGQGGQWLLGCRSSPFSPLRYKLALRASCSIAILIRRTGRSSNFTTRGSQNSIQSYNKVQVLFHASKSAELLGGHNCRPG